jgi:hypothetical protein
MRGDGDMNEMQRLRKRWTGQKDGWDGKGEGVGGRSLINRMAGWVGGNNDDQARSGRRCGRVSRGPFRAANSMIVLRFQLCDLLPRVIERPKLQLLAWLLAAVVY